MWAMSENLILKVDLEENSKSPKKSKPPVETCRKSYERSFTTVYIDADSRHIGDIIFKQ